MTSTEFKDLLVSGVEVPVYHIMAAPDEECPVLCWQEISHNHQYGDDGPVCDVVTVQLDYFTETEYDGFSDELEANLYEIGVSYEFEGQTYDNDREEWRYIWRVEFLGG